MARKLIYISGPITKGDRLHNFNQAAEAQRDLIREGFAPINPMVTMLLPYAWCVSHREWLEVDLAIVEVVDAVLRLPGESAGADMETEHAEDLSIPVFHTVDEICEWDGKCSFTRFLNGFCEMFSGAATNG